MAPNTLFDKSFIQGLSLNESVWFDRFFRANVCPIFYTETLADLSKKVEGRSPEDEVRIIADKFPECAGTPNAYHLSACISELLGEPIPMTGQILIAGGFHISTSQGPGVVFKHSAEAKAFARWGKRDFAALEHEHATQWRSALPEIRSDTSTTHLRDLGVDASSCKTLEQSREFAREIVDGKRTILEVLPFAFGMLNVPGQLHPPIITAWKAAGCPRLAEYAPYTAFVMSIQFFFHIAVANKLVSTIRSNSTDVAYLFYLPFCQVFVSSDRLHERTAPLFMRTDQSFVWGQDLKRDLARLNEHFGRLPDEVKKQGIFQFAPHPPTDGGFLVAEIWDRVSTNWRKTHEPEERREDGEIIRLMDEIKQKSRVTRARPEMEVEASDMQFLSVQRCARHQKGSWIQIPEHVNYEDE